MTAFSFALYDAFSATAFGGSQAAVKTDASNIEPQMLLRLVDCLAQSGFDETAIRGFLGENFHRVAATTWQTNGVKGT